MAELTPLSILITADADDLKAEIAAARAAISKFEAQTKKGGAGARGFGDRLKALGNVSKGTRSKIQQTSFQLQDIIVQLQMGTSASTTFAQQLPQLAGSFGAVGAVVGVLAGIGIPALAVALDSLGGSSKTLEEHMEALDDIMGSVGDTTEILNSSTDELVQKYGAAAERVREFAIAQAELAASQAERRLRDQVGLLDDVISRYSAVAEAVEIAGYKMENDLPLANLQKDLKVNADQAQILMEAFTQLGQADTFSDQQVALDKILETMQEQGVALSLLPPELQLAVSEMITLSNEADAAKASMDRLAASARDVSTGVPLFLQGFTAQGLLPPSAGSTTKQRGGGGGRAKDTTEAELEKLQQSLMSKEELELASFERQQQLLQESLEKKLITQEEYNALMEDAQARHAQRMAAVYSAQGDSALATTLGSASDVLSAMGAFNDKAFKMAKVAGAAQALVSTLQGSAEALKLPYPLNLAAAASVMAKGLGLVAAIKGVSSGGSGGGSAAATGALAADPVQPGQNIVIDFQGDTFTKQGGIALIESINEALRDGGQIDGILAR